MVGIPVRCSRCHRVRLGGYGAPWEDHPGKLKGEVLGFCATCGELLKRLSDERRAREGRALLHRRAQGYGPPAEGEDVFRGLREDEMSDRALAVVEAQPVGLPATMENAPATVLAEAQKAATALHDVIKRKPKPVEINGETYLEYEDWATVGRFYGVTAGIEHEPEYVTLGDAKGFKATAIALRGGQVISRATAFCLSDEERWASAPTYQVASMAQTRACAKVLRNVLSWVAVLAGYKPTPAEEMDGVRGAGQQHRAAPMPACPKCGKTKSVMKSKYAKPGATHYCNPKGNEKGCGAQFEPRAVEPGDEPWNPDDEAGAEG